MSNPYADDVSVFCVTFTRSVIAWNEMERAARAILKAHGPGSTALSVSLLHLSNVALYQSLRAIVDLFRDRGLPHVNEAVDHIDHFALGFDRLRLHRNFYVHAIRGLGKNARDPAIFEGVLYQEEAKGRLSSITESISTTELQSFLEASMRGHDYGQQIAANLEKDTLVAAVTQRKKVPFSDLVKPEWPAEPRKTRLYWGDEFRTGA